MPTNSRTRASRFLLQWEAADGLDQNGNLVVRSGQTPTFTRGGTAGAASAVDANGRIYVPGVSSPRFHHQYNAATGLWAPGGVLLERASTNLVVQSDALTAANGWTVDAGITPTPAYSTVGALNLTRLTGITGGATAVHRNVTLTGDGVKAFSCVVQFDGVAGTTDHGLYDVTGTTIRCRVTVTWAANGTATAIANTGTLLLFRQLGTGAYRIEAQTTTCTAAHTHQIYAVDISTGTSTAVRIGGCQVEDAAFPSSITSTTTGTVTRSADTFSLAFNAVPQAMTAYADIVNLGTWQGGAAGLFDIGIYNGVNPTTLLAYASGGNVHGNLFASFEIESIAACAALVGDRVEARIAAAANGSIITGASLNSTAEALGLPSAANVLSASLRTAVVNFGAANAAAGTAAGAIAIRSFRLAAGVQSLAYMQQA